MYPCLNLSISLQVCRDIYIGPYTLLPTVIVGIRPVGDGHRPDTVLPLTYLPFTIHLRDYPPQCAFCLRVFLAVVAVSLLSSEECNFSVNIMPSFFLSFSIILYKSCNSLSAKTIRENQKRNLCRIVSCSCFFNAK